VSAEETDLGKPRLSADPTIDNEPPAPGMPDLAAIEALPLLDGAGAIRPLDELEADIIRHAVSHYRGQMSEVARRLQIGRSTLYRKLELLGLSGGECREPETNDESVAGERQPQKIARIGAD
jgi:DNA-binding NtrC family response regulator